METLFAVAEFLLVVTAILTITMIVREVFPSLKPEDQASLRGPWIGPSLRVLRRRDRAISNAWNEHVRSFPRSRKRLAFAFCLAGAVLGPMLYVVSLALTGSH